MQASIGLRRPISPFGTGSGNLIAVEKEVVMSSNKSPTPAPGFFERLVELLAATDRFVGWWGAHRAWPANECPRIGRCR
jgi:hypothetical protein